MTQLTNPKDVEALKTDKAPLDYLEPAADEGIARALKFGADKYGPRNYTLSPIAARVYVAAMRRHLNAWLRGEDYAEDSGCHHLDHIGANVHVAKAAIEAGTFIDDRHNAGQERDADDVAVDDLVERHELRIEGSVLQREIRRVFRPAPVEVDGCWDAPSEHAAALRMATEDEPLDLSAASHESSLVDDRPTPFDCPKCIDVPADDPGPCEGCPEAKPTTRIDVYSPAAKGVLAEAVRGILSVYDLDLHHDSEADLVDEIAKAVMDVIA